MIRRLLAAVGAALVLASCRVDVAVELTIAADGTGELVVRAEADADVVEQTPGLVDDLRFDDARDAGWTVDGPEGTDEGGLAVSMRHEVSSAADATNLLASLGPPFVDLVLTRTSADETATVGLTGRLALAGGFDAFADADLLEAVGGSPFAARLAAADAQPSESMSVTLRADLPGDVESTTGEHRDGALEWAAPLDGSSFDVATRSIQRPGQAGSSGLLATGALVGLVVWVSASALFIGYVVRARRQRAQRRA